VDLNPGTVTLVVTAGKGAKRLAEVLDSAAGNDLCDEIIVVDREHSDEIRGAAGARGVRVIRPAAHCGTGTAMNTGLGAALGEIIVFFDADAGGEITSVRPLIEQVAEGSADLAVGSGPSSGDDFGFSLALARWGVRNITGFQCSLPTCGHRAMRRKALDAVYPLRKDYGAGTAMIVDALRAGLKVVEIPLDDTTDDRHHYGFLTKTVRAAGQVSAISGSFYKYRLPAPGKWLKEITHRHTKKPGGEDAPGERREQGNIPEKENK